MSGEQMSGHVMLTGRCGLWTTATAFICRMRGVSIIGSRLQGPESCWSYSILELRRIVPADSLPRLGPAAASRQLLQQKT